MDTSNSNRLANLAFMWMLAPILTIIVGSVLLKTSSGWDSIAYFYKILIVSVILCLIPASLAVLAFMGGTENKEKALISIFVPVVLIFLYVVSFGWLGVT